MLLLEMPEVIRCPLLYMLEAVEGRLCLLEVLEVLVVTEVRGKQKLKGRVSLRRSFRSSRHW